MEVVVVGMIALSWPDVDLPWPDVDLAWPDVGVVIIIMRLENESCDEAAI